MSRVFLSMTEEEVSALDEAREKVGMKPEQEASKVSEQEINYNSSHRARK